MERPEREISLPPLWRKKDLWWLLLPAVAGVAALLLFLSPGGTAVVRQDGQVVCTLPLDRPAERKLQANGHSLSLHIQNGTVWVDQATCPDKVCQTMGPIRAAGQCIVCLPAGISVTVTGDAPDGLTR